MAESGAVRVPEVVGAVQAAKGVPAEAALEVPQAELAVPAQPGFALLKVLPFHLGCSQMNRFAARLYQRQPTCPNQSKKNQ